MKGLILATILILAVLIQEGLYGLATGIIITLAIYLFTNRCIGGTHAKR